MNTNDNRLKAHKLIDHIFQDLLPAHGMAQRPEQIQLSHRMLDAMQDGRIALCDAGTGIGKTYAYLAAATAASAFPTGQIARPIIISTSSIALQNAVLTEYLPLLSCVLMADGILTKPLKAVIRKGKSHYVCDERLDRRLRQVYPAKKNPEALTALRTLRETLDMDRVSHLSGYDRERVCVPQVCDCKQRDCRYQRFLKTCDKDQFLFQICNHNLLVADAIHRSEGKRPIFPEHSIIIVDEAHKLPETAQQMLGVTLAAEEIRNLILQLKEERYLLAAEMLEDSTGPLRRKLAQPREEAEPVEACLRLLTAPSCTLPIIQRQIGSLLSPLGSRQLNTVLDAVKLFTSSQTDMIFYTAEDVSTGGAMLCAAAGDITQRIKKILWQPDQAFVLTSGTMAVGSDFRRFKTQAGLEKGHRVMESVSPSPFDYRNNCLLYLPQIPPRQRVEDTDVYFNELTAELVGLIKAATGHALVLFTSYCRVSTDSEEQLNSYEAQKTYYTQKIQDSPDWEMAGIYADEGISGTSLKKRTQFNKMITACKRGHIDLIITKSLSRFARNTVDCLDTVRLLKANGIGVYFEKENINTLTESSEFLITLFSGFAQAESESLSKNVAWGKQKSAEAGKVTFQYKKMLGYRKGADGQPEIVPEEAEIIRRIYHRYLDGCTLGQIKRELEKDGVPTAQGVERWSPSIIHNILTNEKYIGDALLQKTYVTDCINKKVKKNRGERTMYYVENSHPAIVSRDLFNQVQQEMTRRSSKRKVLQKSGKTELGKYSGKYALTELLVCGECGSPYKRVTWARNGKKRIVWRCVSRLEFGTKYCQHSPTLDEGKLHSAILAAMNEYAAIRQEVCPDVLAMAEEARQALSQAGARLLQLKKRMDAVSREQSDVLDRLLVNMADTELNARMKALTDEKESLKAQIADAQQAEVDLEEQAARRRQMWDSIMECAAGYTEFDNELVRQVIQKITVEDAETIRIQFRDSDVVLEQEVE